MLSRLPRIGPRKAIACAAALAVALAALLFHLYNASTPPAGFRLLDERGRPRLAGPETESSLEDGYIDYSDNAARLNQRGLQLFSQGRYGKAADAFDEALELSPDDSAIRSNLVRSLLRAGWAEYKRKRYKDSLDYFDWANEVAPREPDAMRGLAYTYNTLGDEEETITWFEELHDVSPSDEVAAFKLTEIYYRRDEIEDALDVIDAFLATNPRHREALEWRKKLRQDDRVEETYDEKETTHFDVRYDGGENIMAGYIISGILEDAYRQVGRDFRYWPDRKVVAVLYTRKEYRRTLNAPDWTGALYDGKIRIPVGGVTARTRDLERTVIHEYMHHVVHGITRGRCPTWLNEGLAQYEEGEYSRDLDLRLRPLAQRERLIPLRMLQGSFIGLNGEMVMLAYAQSLSVVNYLIKEFTFYKIRHWLDRIGDGDDPIAAFEAVYPLSFEDFEKRWRVRLAGL